MSGDRLDGWAIKPWEGDFEGTPGLWTLRAIPLGHSYMLVSRTYFPLIVPWL